MLVYLESRPFERVDRISEVRVVEVSVEHPKLEDALECRDLREMRLIAERVSVTTGRQELTPVRVKG